MNGDAWRPGEAGEIDALLFDLGGVVINIDFGKAFEVWARSAGTDPRELAARFSMDESYEQHETGAIDGATFFASLRKSLGLDLSDEDMATGWNSIYDGLVDGIDELLGECAQRWPLFAFTNSNKVHESRWSVDFAPVLTHFRHVFVSSTIGLRKPSAESFAHCAAHIDVPVDRIVFFDDSVVNVDGARDAGLRAVHVRSIADVTTALAM